MRLDDVLNGFAGNRDYLILGLVLLVLVEGGIIMLWARRVARLRMDLQRAVSAAEDAQVAAGRAAVATEAGALRAANALRRAREVYAVSTEPVATDALVAPPLTRQGLDAAASAVPAPTPTPAAPAEEHPEPPAEYVSPVVQQAAAWMLPEVEASRPAAEPEPEAEPAPSHGNGHANGWLPAPTTMGWSGQAVPVEPAADFAVLSEHGGTGNSPAPHPSASGSPSLTVLNGATAWPAMPSAQEAPVPTHIDPAMFDTNDDVPDDEPISGDILLVEDDPTIARLYRMLLESRGYTVRHAGDGLDGLDRVNEKRPDLVLLDIMMPRMNGIAFLQALRSGDERDVPVVVLSNFMEKQLVDDAMSLGALEYMVKAQTRPEALVGALPHWLRGERAFSF